MLDFRKTEMYNGHIKLKQTEKTASFNVELNNYMF